jgi:flagellar biosynthesis/type III secretory pathway chaperone
MGMMCMKEQITDLVELLEQQNKVYMELLEISRRKTKVIVEGRVGQLDRLTRLEQKVVFRAGCLEKRREELLIQLAGQDYKNADRVSLGPLLDKAGGRLKERFMNLREDIAGTLLQLKEVNDLNSSLIEKSLEYIKLSLDIVTDRTSGITYGKRAGSKEVESIGLFDKKV